MLEQTLMESHATTVLDLRGHFSSITKMNVLGLGLDNRAGTSWNKVKIAHLLTP